jgi:hypothetical protein
VELIDGRTDGTELSLKLYHESELQAGYQQSVTEAPGELLGLLDFHCLVPPCGFLWSFVQDLRTTKTAWGNGAQSRGIQGGATGIRA